jgi:hypothetical protein
MFNRRLFGELPGSLRLHIVMRKTGKTFHDFLKKNEKFFQFFFQNGATRFTSTIASNKKIQKKSEKFPSFAAFPTLRDKIFIDF